MKKLDRYAEAQAFVRIAETGGIGAAAENLGVAPSVISRRLQALEARLGSRLIERSTRRVRLTEAGQLYLPRMQHWLAELDDADAMIADRQGGVRGVLRMTVPSNFGRLHVVPRLAALLHRYPELSLDLDFSDHFQDFVHGGFDLAIRIGRLPDSTLVARKLADNRRMLVASPAYLAQAGVPSHPRELGSHACLHFSPFREGEHWHFERDGERLDVPVQGRVRANYGEALYEAALAGFGILQSASFVVGPALRDGRLVELLPEWRLPDIGIYAVWPKGRFIPPKIRAVVDYLVECFAGTPPWDARSPTPLRESPSGQAGRGGGSNASFDS